MATWGELAEADPELAAAGERLLAADLSRPPLLATVREGEPPRLHPVNVGIVDGRLWTFVGRSAKLRDLEADGRYALHGWVDPHRPHEFVVRGIAAARTGADERRRVAGSWAFTPDDTFVLFELDIADLSLGTRPDADAWPPTYRRWGAAGDGG